MAWLKNVVITYQQKCLDGFEGAFKNKLMNFTIDATQLTGNALSTINGLPKILESFGIISSNLHQSNNKNGRCRHRRLLQIADGINNNNNNDDDGYPSWFSFLA